MFGFRLDSLDASTTEARAARLLHGLGFTKTMQQKRTRDFSGGWRMRIALARALFVDPTFLILDGVLLPLLLLGGLPDLTAFQTFKRVTNAADFWCQDKEEAETAYVVHFAEPTNHLDLEACVWLEDTLQHFKRILLLVSHSQDFMNNVCTNIIRLHQKKLVAYGGEGS